MLWANTNSLADAGFQQRIFPLMETLVGTTRLYGDRSPPLKIAEMYYTHHGVPINEDKTWDYANRYSLRTAGIDEIGRASCRERVCQYVYISVVAVSLKKKNKTKSEEP